MSQKHIWSFLVNTLYLYVTEWYWIRPYNRTYNVISTNGQLNKERQQRFGSSQDSRKQEFGRRQKLWILIALQLIARAMLPLLLSEKKKKNPKLIFKSTWFSYVSREPSMHVGLKIKSTYVHTKLYSRNEYFKAKAPSFLTERRT